MDSPFLVSCLWLLCMVAAVAHAARRRVAVVDLMWPGLAFGVTLVAAQWMAPRADWTGGAVGVSAVWQLLRPLPPRVGLALAGAFSALAAALYASHGAPVGLSAAASVLILVAGLWFASDPRYSRASARGAFILLAWASPVVAAAPGVIDGWKSAQALNASAVAVADRVVPGWAFLVLAAALAVGLLHGFLVRK